MAMEVEISKEFTDSLYRSGVLKLRTSEVTLPIKATSSKKLGSSVQWNRFLDSLKGSKQRIFDENHVNINEDWVEHIRKSSDLSELSQRLSRNANGHINYLVPNWNSTTFPSSKILGPVTIAQSSPIYSDIYSPPLLSKILKKDPKFSHEKIISYEAEYFDVLTTQKNGKGKFGYLPIKSSLAGFEDYLTFFSKNDMDGIIVDFNGCTPNGVSIHLSALFHTLEEKYDKRPILYAINAHKGVKKSIEDPTVRPAKDIYLFEYGFDIVGENHVPRFFPTTDKTEKKTMEKIEPKYWFFDHMDYGYHLKKTGVFIDEKKNNWREFFIESKIISETLSSDHEVLPYLKTKKFVDEKSLKIMSKLKKKK